MRNKTWVVLPEITRTDDATPSTIRIPYVTHTGRVRPLVGHRRVGRLVGASRLTECVLPRAGCPGRVTPSGRRGAGNPRRPLRNLHAGPGPFSRTRYALRLGRLGRLDLQSARRRERRLVCLGAPGLTVGAPPRAAAGMSGGAWTYSRRAAASGGWDVWGAWTYRRLADSGQRRLAS